MDLGARRAGDPQRRASRAGRACIRPLASHDERIQLDGLFDEDMLVALPTGHPRLVERALHPLSRRLAPTIHDAIIASCPKAGLTPTLVSEAPQVSSTINLVAKPASAFPFCRPRSSRSIPTRRQGFARYNGAGSLVNQNSLKFTAHDASFWCEAIKSETEVRRTRNPMHPAPRTLSRVSLRSLIFGGHDENPICSRSRHGRFGGTRHCARRSSGAFRAGAA